MSFFYVFDLLIGDYHFIGNDIYSNLAIDCQIELANEWQPLHLVGSIEFLQFKVKLEDFDLRILGETAEILQRVNFGGGIFKRRVAEENFFGLAARQFAYQIERQIFIETSQYRAAVVTQNLEAVNLLARAGQIYRQAPRVC